jgi:hypothetical protein
MTDLLAWLRAELSQFRPQAAAILLNSNHGRWPIRAGDQAELLRELDDRQALAPLPTESAALANVIEVGILQFLRRGLEAVNAQHPSPVVKYASAGPRAYPDLEVGGPYFGGDDHVEAVDIKVARRNKRGSQTQSRITLYTGNTYFKYPHLRLPGILRPFDDYARHLDVLVIYDFLPDGFDRLGNVEIIVHEAWRIASRERSSRECQLNGVSGLA